MAQYRYAVGTVARSLATGSQVVSVADATGSFPVKAVLLYTTFQSANGFAGDARVSYGFSDGIQQCSIQSFTPNANATTKFSRSHYGDIYALVANSAAPTTLTDAAAVSAVSDGSFTLNWLANDGTPWDIHYIAFGGSDLQAKVITAFQPLTPSTQAITGIGFQPTGVIALDTLSVGDISLGVPTIAAATVNLGWSDGTNDVANAGNLSGFPANTFASRSERTTAAIIRSAAIGATQSVLASVVSFDADGFTLDWSAVSAGPASGANATGFYALVIGGPTILAGSVTQSDPTIATAFPTGLALLSTFGRTASAVGEADTIWCLGAVTATTLASAWMGNVNGAATSVATRHRSTSAVTTGVTQNVVPSSSAVIAAVTPTFGETAVTLAWSPDDSVARQVLYLLMEGADIAPEPPQPFPPSAGVTIPMRKLRRSPTISNEKLQMFFTRFCLDFQAGGPRDGHEPIDICLRYSDDSGNTWSDELWLQVDHYGEYNALAQWFQLGVGRDRVWEVSSTSAAMTVWLAAYLDLEAGTHV